MHTNVRVQHLDQEPHIGGGGAATGRERASAQVGSSPAPSGRLTCDSGESGTASLSERSFRNRKTIWFGLRVTVNGSEC